MKICLNPSYQYFNTTCTFDKKTALKVNSFNQISEICSKNAANCLKTNVLPFKGKAVIPDLGKIPDSIVKKCQTGEKGKIIDKNTHEQINVTADIKRLSDHYNTLNIYDKNDEKLGYATYGIASKKCPYLMGSQDYIGDGKAVFIEYMRNCKNGQYQHVGTLLHRLIHEISKQNGCDGKVILLTVDSAARFHYDSGFRPLASLNPKQKTYKLNAELTELNMATGHYMGSCGMYLDEKNMEKLQNGQHVISDEYRQGISEKKYLELYDELHDKIRQAIEEKEKIKH